MFARPTVSHLLTLQLAPTQPLAGRYARNLAQALKLLGADERPNRLASAQLKRLRLVALSGPGAVPIRNTSADFLKMDLRTRARLSAIGTLLSRVPARPRVSCDSPWAIRMRGGVRGIVQTPGERWPFAGVGINVAQCSQRAPSEPGGVAACCAAVYGKKLHAAQVDCLPAVHPAFLEHTLASTRQRPLEVHA